MSKIQNIKRDFHDGFRSFGFRILNLFRASDFEFRIFGRAGFTPSLKFRQPQLVPSDTSEHIVFESNVFPPALSGWQKNQPARHMPAHKPRNLSKFCTDAQLRHNSVHRRMAGGSKFSAGFTLIEMAVATGIFAILVVSAVSVMISVTKAQAKIQRVQTAIDNVRFSLELITKEMRVGTEYEYYSDCDLSGPAQSGFRFTTSTGGKRIYYFDTTNDRIMRSKTALCSDAVPFTAEDVRVDRFRVLLRGIPAGSSDGQPWATFNMKVTVLDPKGASDFSMDLQTSVVQRGRDFP